MLSLVLRTPKSNLARRKVMMQTPSRWAAVSMLYCVRLPSSRFWRSHSATNLRWVNLQQWAGPSSVPRE